jgi:hypothetical protein
VKLKLAEDLSLPIATVTEKLAWLGRTGSGKTYGAMKLAELMLEAGAQIGAIDPVGVWRALRVPADKDGKAFDVVVFGGLYGDLPLEPTETAGHLVADLVCDRGVSFVLDVSQFIPSEQQRFVRAFGDRFFHRKKSASSAVHLFMEECQEFIPENPSGEEAKTLGVMQRLWKLGRNFGIGGSLISQRPQEIAKKALNMSGTMFAFQMTGPQERAAVRKWVADQGIASDIEGVLQKLRTGEPHVESPTFLEVSKTVRILPRVTADLSSTPKVGASTVAKRPLTPIDVAQLKTAMAATIEKAKADDPRELRKQIAELKAENSKLTNSSIRPNSLTKKITKPALTDADRALLEKVAGTMGEAARLLTVNTSFDVRSLLTDIERRLQQFKTDLLTEQSDNRAAFVRQLEAKGFQKILAKLVTVPAPHQNIPQSAGPRMPASRVSAGGSSDRARPAPGSNGTGELGRVHRAFLTVLANRQGKPTRRNQLAVFSGYSAKSRHVDNTISALRTSGYLVGSSDALQITSAGLEALGTFEPLPTGRALIDYWIRESGTAPGAMLSALVNVYPRTMTRDEVAEAANYSPTSRHVDNSLSYLRTLELITGDRSALSASQELFA